MEQNAIYHCSQQQLYATAIIGWNNYNANVADFTAFKGKYTVTFGENGKLAVIAARNMPDDQTRNSISENLRVELVETGNRCLEYWQRLKSYTTEAFREPLHKGLLEAAGSGYYRNASQQNWQDMEALVTAAFNFIDEHGSELSMEGQNMPEAFPELFGAAKTAFETNYNTFIDAEQNSTGGTSNKIQANNEVYDTLMKMMADGQLIYRNDPVKKSLFVFESILSYITTPGTTGLRISAKDKVTQLPVEGFVVTAQPGNITGTTDEDGVLELALSENTYSLTGVKDGYVDYREEDVSTTTGTMSRKNIELRTLE